MMQQNQRRPFPSGTYDSSTMRSEHSRNPPATAPHGPPPQQWGNTSTAIRNRAAPIPISFAIPEAYSATAQGGPVLVDPYTVSFSMNPPLVIPANSLCELIQASFAYSQPNIANPGVLQSVPNGNNRLTIQAGTANPWLDVVLPQGLYDYTDVQEQLNIYVRTHNVSGGTGGPFIVPSGTPTDLFQLIGISSTQTLIITLNPAALAGGVFPAGGFSVSFTNPSPSGAPGHTSDSIGLVLGWPVSGVDSTFTAPAASAAIYSAYAPNVADFGFTTAYSLYVSFVTDSYLNGITGQLLYVFPLGASSPNSIVAFQPTRRFPVQLNAGNFSTLNIWTADQSGNRLPWSLYQAPFQFSAIISRSREDGSL